MYIQIDKDKFIQYDSDNQTVSIISKSSLEKQINDLMVNTPSIPLDSILLAWAKENYPGISIINEVQTQISNLQDQLDQMNKNSIDVSSQVVKNVKGGQNSPHS